MSNSALRLTTVLCWAALMTGCGGNSSTTPDPIPDTPVNVSSGDGSGFQSGDDGTDTGDTDTDTDAGGTNTGDTVSSGTDSSNTGDGSVAGTDVDNNDDNTSAYCAAISTDISYELFSGQCQCGTAYARYVPSGYPGIYGWDGNNYCDLTSSTNVEEIDLLVPFSGTPPEIDGISNTYPLDWFSAAGASWSDDKSDMLLTRNLLTNNGNGYQDGARAADWLILHDMTHLYIHVLVRNEGSGTNFPQIYLDSDDPSEDDSIEIFIDGDNSKGTSYDGVNDYHTILGYLDSSRTPEAGTNSAPGLDIVFDTDEDNRTAIGAWVVYEVKINLASAGITVGKPFGLDIQLNEDDNGGSADATFGWHEPFASNVADSDPSVFGTVVLTSCSDLNDCDLSQSLIGE